MTNSLSLNCRGAKGLKPKFLGRKLTPTVLWFQNWNLGFQLLSNQGQHSQSRTRKNSPKLTLTTIKSARKPCGFRTTVCHCECLKVSSQQVIKERKENSIRLHGLLLRWNAPIPAERVPANFQRVFFLLGSSYVEIFELERKKKPT